MRKALRQWPERQRRRGIRILSLPRTYATQPAHWRTPEEERNWLGIPSRLECSGANLLNIGRFILRNPQKSGVMVRKIVDRIRASNPRTWWIVKSPKRAGIATVGRLNDCGLVRYASFGGHTTISKRGRVSRAQRRTIAASSMVFPERGSMSMQQSNSAR